MYCSDLLESKMSVRFALRVTAEGHRVTPNDFEHYEVKGTPYVRS